MTILRFVLLCCLVVSVAAVPAFGGNPNWPNAPDEDPRLEPPNDAGFENRWDLLSYIPDAALGTIRPEEIPLGSGIHADRAYQVTLGSPDVVIAVLDSGIHWESIDLIDKFYINRGEAPLPQGSGKYDANGDGSFDIRDYNGDPRVTDANANGRIEPGDLIRLFSDGVDDDNNGYVDDIAGWDFFHHDNDPYDDTRYGHGTGESKGAAAAVNDGHGAVGVCPLCQILPVRVGDSFVAESNPFAQGVVFAVDSGAQVILEALGTVNNTPFGRDAVAYAIDRGVSFAASAADENSYHHNFPATYNRTVHTNNILYDTIPDMSKATTFMALDACTNYGPKITVSAASSNCSSGATGRMGGALGMIYSRALQVGLDPPLSPAEVFGIVTSTADDIYDPDGEFNILKYKSLPGWDKFFGHGRLNIRAAVDSIGPETVAPEAYLDSPGWFEIVDPNQPLDLFGYAYARRASGFSATVEVMAGLEPQGDWILVSRFSDQKAPIKGYLGTLDLRKLDWSKATAHDASDHHAVLVRITVRDTLGNSTVYYHSFFALADPDWAEGFPKYLGASGEVSSVMEDLDGDGVFELITPTSEGIVRVFNDQGDPLPGWPAWTGALPGQDPNSEQNYLGSAAYTSGALFPLRHQTIQFGVAVGDLEGNGGKDIVVSTLNGEVYAWDAGGNLKAGFPLAIDPTNSENPAWRVQRGIFSPPVLVDLDHDAGKDLEIVVAAMDQWVYAWHHDGTPLAGWPVLCRDEGAQKARIVSTPAVGDLDGDGEPEVVVTTNEGYADTGRMYAIRAAGYEHPQSAYVPGWPVSLFTIMDDYLPYIGQGTPASPALADIDDNGDVEVVINSGVGIPMLYDGDGTRLRVMSPFTIGLQNGTYELAMGTLNSNCVFADLKGDGRLAVINGGVGLFAALQAGLSGMRIPSEYLVGAWHADTGTRLRHWPNILEDTQLGNSHAVADIDGDDLVEVITGSGGHYLHAYNYYGQEPEGWPKFTGGWITNTPSVGDMDGDGLLEVAIMTREGYLFVWNTLGPADGDVQWSSYAHDPRNTGNYHTPLSPQAGPAQRAAKRTMINEPASHRMYNDADRDENEADDSQAATPGTQCGT